MPYNTQIHVLFDQVSQMSTSGLWRPSWKKLIMSKELIEHISNYMNWLLAHTPCTPRNKDQTNIHNITHTNTNRGLRENNSCLSNFLTHNNYWDLRLQNELTLANISIKTIHWNFSQVTFLLQIFQK